MRRSALRLATLIGIAVLCSCAGYKPLPREQWTGRDNPLFPAVVVVHASGKAANGILIHSCREHGTYVLCPGGRKGKIRVGVLDHSFRSGPSAQKFYQERIAEEVAALEFRLGPQEEAFTVALIRVAAPEGEEPWLLRAPEWCEAPPARGADRPDQIVSLLPERRPHAHPAAMAEDVGYVTIVEEPLEHSGSGLFRNGKLTGLLVEVRPVDKYTRALGALGGTGDFLLSAKGGREALLKKFSESLLDSLRPRTPALFVPMRPHLADALLNAKMDFLVPPFSCTDD